MAEDLFWADQLAKEIINRKKFHYLDSPIKQPKEFVVKTSASLSGVLHIGRLSDTIRGETVNRALNDAGVKSKLIWVAEDMDPLRKVPKGVPASYEKYLGMPVTEVPDPDGCHESYAKHHMEEYFKVIDEFTVTKMEKYSMREEYKKGNFSEYIKKVLENLKIIKEIQNKYRSNPLPGGWSPWTPICENCGKISTAKITEFDGQTVKYKCEDYAFEKTKAKGCGHTGVADPVKDPGKMMWKSEWASQWARFNVCSEGAGKEYQVPNSAFWVNAEIVERVLNYPMPVPIFYEHIMIDNQKMSASLGNVVYPKDWLDVAGPELLRMFYNKRLMKTRSFSWRNLPKLYDEYEGYAKVYSGEIKPDNEKEASHQKRLFEVSHGKNVEKPLAITFSHASVISQVFPEEENWVSSLKKTGQYDEKEHERIAERLKKAKIWLDKYAPEEMKFQLQDTVSKDITLSAEQRKGINLLVEYLKNNEYDENILYEKIYNICNENNIEPKDLFKAAYLILLNKERGPKLANFIVTLGKEKVLNLLKQVC